MAGIVVRRITGKLDIDAGRSPQQLKRFDGKLDKVSTNLKKTQVGATKATKATKSFGNQAKVASGKVGKLNSTVSGLKAFAGTAFVSAGLFALKSLGTEAVNLASDFEEAKNKFDVTFKGFGDEGAKAVKTLNEEFGFSNKLAVESLANTGDILSGFGLAGKEALDMSFAVNKLSGDLSSFANVPVERASRAITSALLGEREAAKSLGIVIREADVQNRLAAKNMDKLTGNALLQAKAMVTLEIATEQSKNAQGDFLRSIDSFANSSKVFNNAIEDIKISLGAALIEGIKPIQAAIAPLVASFAKFIKTKDGMETFKNILQGFGIFILAVLIPILITLGTVLFAALSPVNIWIFAIVGIIALLVAFRKQIKEAFINSFNAVKTFFTKFGKFALILLGPIGLIIAGLIELQKRFDIFGKIGKGFKAIGSFFGFGGGDKAKKSEEAPAVRVGGTKSVNDAIITKKGDVIETSPDDDIIATKGLSGGSGGVGGGGGFGGMKIGSLINSLVIQVQGGENVGQEVKNQVMQALDELTSQMRAEVSI